MASGTVAVRLPDEVLEQLQRRAAAENKKVSDVVRELIISGLQQTGNDPAILNRLDRLEALGDRATKAALKAQFLANMSASYAVDVSRLMSGIARNTGWRGVATLVTGIGSRKCWRRGK